MVVSTHPYLSLDTILLELGTQVLANENGIVLGTPCATLPAGFPLQLVLRHQHLDVHALLCILLNVLREIDGV